MHKIAVPILSAVLLIVLLVPASVDAKRKNRPQPPPPPPTVGQCTTGWYITGYFTPIESDYTGITKAVIVEGKSYTFNSAFLTEVQTEGWGKTHLGNYIGYWDNTWHFASAALDSRGNALRSDSVAIDPSVIPFGTKLTIPTLPTGWNTKVFTATDVGTAVIGKHVDVYTGEGKAAEAMTYQITGTNTVCVQ